jgi:hypothetical protein
MSQLKWKNEILLQNLNIKNYLFFLHNNKLKLNKKLKKRLYLNFIKKKNKILKKIFKSSSFKTSVILKNQLLLERKVITKKLKNHLNYFVLMKKSNLKNQKLISLLKILYLSKKIKLSKKKNYLKRKNCLKKKNH